MLNALVNGISVEQVSILDRGLQYGDGVFETMPVYEGKALWFDKHYQRLQQGCATLNITVPKKNILLNDIEQLIPHHQSAVLKITVTRGESARGYKTNRDVKPTRIVVCSEWQNNPQLKIKNGILLKLCDTIVSRHPLLGSVKHLNRLENIMARQEWQGDEYDEGLMCDEFGNVVDGIMSNIFISHNGQLSTPKIKHSGVKGIMRNWVLEQNKSINVSELDRLTVEMVQQADEIFMTNSLIGMWPVREFNNIKYTVGPVFHKLYDKLKMEYPILDA
jgi:4-amino-4-deoxychorismate lyase